MPSVEERGGGSQPSMSSISTARRPGSLLTAASHEGVVHDRVPVDQNVAERHKPRQIGDQGGAAGIDPRQLGQRLADDLELPLDDKADEVVSRVLREPSAVDEALSQVRCVQGTPEV